MHFRIVIFLNVITTSPALKINPCVLEIRPKLKKKFCELLNWFSCNQFYWTHIILISNQDRINFTIYSSVSKAQIMLAWDLRFTNALPSSKRNSVNFWIDYNQLYNFSGHILSWFLIKIAYYLLISFKSTIHGSLRFEIH